MSRESRYANNQKSINQAKTVLSGARAALDRFRYNGDPSGFPALCQYLSGKSDTNYHTFNLEGWGPDRHNLTEEEYVRFKEAYKATKLGALDDWKDGRNPADTFW